MGLISSGLLLSIPKIIQYIINFIIPNQDYQRLLFITFLLIPLIGAMIVSTWIRNVAQRVVQAKSTHVLQVALLKHIRKLGFSYYERNSVGETLSLFQNELPAIQKINQHYLPLLIERILMLVISISVLISINSNLTILIIPCFLSYYILGPFFEKKQTHYAREGTKSKTEYNKKIYGSLSAIVELKIHQTQAWDLSKVLDKFETNKKNWIYELRFALLRGSARRVTISTGALVLFFYGSQLVSDGALLIGDFVAFLLYYFLVMGDLTRVVTTLTEQSSVLVQGEKLFDFFNTEPEVSEKADALIVSDIKGEVVLEQVKFGYVNGDERIRGISIDIPAGQRVALVGASGGGKTTLLKLIGRFYDPSEGSISIDRKSIKDMSLTSLRNALGYVFQDTYLFGTSAKENIRFGNPSATDEEVVSAAKAAYAHEFIEQLPLGYETYVGERGVNLSGGQRQRIAIARMILKNPSIVLLDEATSGLDNIIEREVQLAMERLLSGRTTIAIAHRISTIRDFDLIVVIENGLISERGSYNALMEAKGALYHMVKEGDRKVV